MYDIVVGQNVNLPAYEETNLKICKGCFYPGDYALILNTIINTLNDEGIAEWDICMPEVP